MNKADLSVKNLEKSYHMSGSSVEVPVLKDVSFSATAGEWIALLGASGSGKTTLLNLLGTLEKPDSGELHWKDLEYANLSERQQSHFRRSKLGFVFQAYHLLPELNVLDNVLLASMLNHSFGLGAKSKAEELLEQVGLKHRLKHRPNELSGGEQQRVAIARSLINNPELLLLDEPTGNLDQKTGNEILKIFQDLRQNFADETIIMVTHNHEVAKFADRTIELVDGMISP